MIKQPRLNVVWNLQDGEDEQWNKDYVPTHKIVNEVKVLDKFGAKEKAKLAHCSNAVVGCKSITNKVTVLDEDGAAADHETNSN